MTDITTSQNSEDVGRPYDQLILFGDSITEMSHNQALGFAFGAQLQESYSRRLDVINRGFAGYTTAHAVKVFPRVFPSPQAANVRLMTIFFGANDACVPGQSQHVPLPVYKENLQKIIQHPATRAQDPRIILITPPPVNEYQLEGFDILKNTPHPSRTAHMAKTYADAVKEVGASLKVPVADIWSAFMLAVGWQEGQPLIGSRDVPNNDRFGTLFTDGECKLPGLISPGYTHRLPAGLHLTPGGYRIVYDEVMRTIRANWPDQDPAVLPMVFPSWGEAPR
ncbi:Esterase SGNH hydrolase-type subgroup [Penicillium canariense]|uniref:Esterase SGNH hydrolase-type subgroup n=1 Tax=Penicillium canariense TaxID=189055 RepID=A0A9W9HLJ8_9EURO|nr:Esterase SGNH hydrolase-type subgroup [Penicillium canariense]KAJ5151204.1 Esterase SGNH hydrolase-type subgroup [Penicillium canariense]